MTTIAAVTPGVRAPKTGLHSYRWPANATNGSQATPTPVPNASAGAEVVQTRPGGPPIIVERGPRWLAELAFNPPGWLLPLIGMVAFAVVALAVLGAVRHGELDRQLQRELVQSGTTVVAAMIFAFAAQRIDLPFWVVAVLAGGGGWLVALSVTRVGDRVDGAERA